MLRAHLARAHTQQLVVGLQRPQLLPLSCFSERRVYPVVDNGDDDDDDDNS